MLEPVLDPVLLTYVTVTVLPGLAIGLALGLRGWLLAAATPALTYGLVGTAGTWLPLAGVDWSPATFALTAVLVAVAAALVRFGALRLRPDSGNGDGDLPPWSAVHHVGVAVGAAVAAGVGVAAAWQATRGFTAVPQIWDSVFHANATRYIAATGHSDPAALQALNNPVTDSYYYPNAYHVTAATVVMLTGATVPTVMDASVALFTGLLAVGTAALVRTTGGRPALAAAAALLSCAFTAFPYDLLPWGTLLPFVTAVALLPAFLALWAAVLRPEGATVVPRAVALGLAGLGLLALHPSGAVAAALLGAALLAQLWVQRRPRLRDLRATGATAVTAVLLGAPLLLASTRAAATIAFDWPADMRPADAMGQVLFLGHGQEFPQYWLVALAAVGLLRPASWRPLLWLVGTSVVFAALFVMAAAYEGPLVALLTRPWWNDRWRFAALFTLGALVLAAGGLVAVRDLLWSAAGRIAPGLRGLPEGRRLGVSTAALAAVAAAVVLLSNGLYLQRNEVRLAQGFTDGPTVSSAEREAFGELARLVPPGEAVMNDPYDGSALMWALDDVRPVFATPVIPAQELPTMDPNRRVVFESFDRLDTDVAVQQAVAALDVDYVVLCTGFIGPASDHAPGLRRLDQVQALDLIFENADARIYRIDRARLAAT